MRRCVRWTAVLIALAISLPATAEAGGGGAERSRPAPCCPPCHDRGGHHFGGHAACHDHACDEPTGCEREEHRHCHDRPTWTSDDSWTSNDESDDATSCGRSTTTPAPAPAPTEPRAEPAVVVPAEPLFELPDDESPEARKKRRRAALARLLRRAAPLASR